MSDRLPAWVCSDCGEKYGFYAVHSSTWHEGRCLICYKVAPVTVPRDFGYLPRLKEGGEG